MGDRAIVSVQNPFQASDLSQPEPDVSILKPSKTYYKEGYPQAKDIILLIEVADTSLEYDREIKLPLYAKASIPICWIVNANQSSIEVYSTIKDGVFQKKEVVTKEHFIPVAPFNIKVDVKDLIGKHRLDTTYNRRFLFGDHFKSTKIKSPVVQYHRAFFITKLDYLVLTKVFVSLVVSVTTFTW